MQSKLHIQKFLVGLSIILLPVQIYAENDRQLEVSVKAKTISTSQRNTTQQFQQTQQVQQVQPMQPTYAPQTYQQRRKYFQEDPQRVDAGIFHVGFAVGGNFYMEPLYLNNVSNGYSKDAGFQAGVFFDHDYSELTENVPLMLRGMLGYKYVLSSVHVFTFDGMVRHMWRWSEKASFGLGMGGSFALWYRTVTPTSPQEQTIILPSFLLGAGFEFNPFMVDFKWLINRISSESTIMGFELYFGFRL